MSKDVAELDTFIGQAKRQRNIDALSLQKKRVETEITNLREQIVKNDAAKPTSAVAANSATTPPKRYESEITNFAWDQSDKFVKFFVALDGVRPDDDAKVTVKFTANSIRLSVADVQNKDYKFEVNNLLQTIDVEKSYRKVKTNSIAIYAKKSQEGESDDDKRSLKKILL